MITLIFFLLLWGYKGMQEHPTLV